MNTNKPSTSEYIDRLKKVHEEPLENHQERVTDTLINKLEDSLFKEFYNIRFWGISVKDIEDHFRGAIRARVVRGQEKPVRFEVSFSEHGRPWDKTIWGEKLFVQAVETHLNKTVAEPFMKIIAPKPEGNSNLTFRYTIHDYKGFEEKWD